jgi:hypothetical protein
MGTQGSRDPGHLNDEVRVDEFPGNDISSRPTIWVVHYSNAAFKRIEKYRIVFRYCRISNSEKFMLVLSRFTR